MNKRTALRLALITLFIGLVCGSLLGCNTINGLGQDITDTATFFRDRHNTGWQYN